VACSTIHQNEQAISEEFIFPRNERSLVL